MKTELESYEKELHEKLMWFERRAVIARKRFLYLRTLQTIILAVLPMLFLYPQFLGSYGYIMSLLGGVLSIIALVITTLMQISNFDSQWQQYRLIAEQVKKEQFSFKMNLGEYSKLNEKERTQSYMERVETIISSERSKWFVGENLGDKL